MKIGQAQQKLTCGRTYEIYLKSSAIAPVGVIPKPRRIHRDQNLHPRPSTCVSSLGLNYHLSPASAELSTDFLKKILVDHIHGSDVNLYCVHFNQQRQIVI